MRLVLALLVLAGCAVSTDRDGDGGPRDGAVGDDAPRRDDGAFTARERPRQIAPLSTARVTSRRPTLRWTLPSGTGGARVDLCRDRALTAACTSFDASGTRGRPSADLEPGVWFWRVTAVPGRESSVVWELLVGARSAPIDTSWGTFLDVNGDGYADLAVGNASSPPGDVYLYLGSPAGLANTPALTIPSAGSVASAGDVDGDGFADLIAGPSVYAGGPDGPALTPSYDASGIAAGDVNGDGYGDLACGSGICFGGPSGPTRTNAQAIPPVDGHPFGSEASAGDVNGDGLGDLLLGSPGGWVGTPSSAYVFLGSASGVGATPASVLTTPNGGPLYGHAVASAGDVDGDGYADVIVGAYNGTFNAFGVSASYLYRGSSSGVAASSERVIGCPVDPPNEHDACGIAVAGAGDTDGDGLADCAVGDDPLVGGTLDRGAVFVHRGSLGGLAISPPTTLSGMDRDDFGSALASGDYDGDGFTDVAVGAPRGGAQVGRVYVFRGTATGIATTPSVTIDPPMPTLGGAFGWWLARQCSSETREAPVRAQMPMTRTGADGLLSSMPLPISPYRPLPQHQTV